MTKIDLESNKEYIAHDNDRQGVIEKSTKEAYLLDGQLFSDLQFQHKNCLKKVDYLKVKNTDNNVEVFLIELTDLQDDMKSCIECEALLFDKSADVRGHIKSLDRKGLKRLQTKIWLETVEEFKGKWMGSIACYERILRITVSQPDELTYHLIVVVKNDTDPKELDLFKIQLGQKLSGIVGRLIVKTTQEL